MGDFEVPKVEGLSLDQLRDRTTFYDVHPSEIFGIRIEPDDEEFDLDAFFSPVKAYFIIAHALKGSPLIAGRRDGVHTLRGRGFLDFDDFSRGLAAEEKIRLVRILQIFLSDIRESAMFFARAEKKMEVESLASIERWANHMLRTLDDKTLDAAIDHGFLEETPVFVAEALEPRRVSNGLRGLIERGVGVLFG